MKFLAGGDLSFYSSYPSRATSDLAPAVACKQVQQKLSWGSMETVAVCDDDVLQLRQTVETLSRFAKERQLLFLVIPCQSTQELFMLQDAKSLDLVFMDIEFDGKPEGIEAVQRINERMPNCQVVYLTNYLQYAVDVYRTDHVWFVLKSQFERRLPELFTKLSAIEESRRAHVVVTAKDGTVANIPCSTIRYLERRERLTSIVTQKTIYQVRDKLPTVLEKLPDSTFARCHNSFVVNMPYVMEIHASELKLDDGKTILISRSYSKGFRERYLMWADSWTV